MQAVLLAAGNSTRMAPFGKRHKSTLFCLGKPLLAWTIEGLIARGVTEVVVVCSSTNGVKECVSKLNFSIPVEVHFSEGARGAGETLLDIADHLRDEFILVNAHQVGVEDYLPDLLGKLGPESSVVLAKNEDDLSPYGALKIEGDRVTKLVEKPSNPKDYDLRIVGVYGLNKKFLEILQKTDKHHYSLEDALSQMVDLGMVKVVVTDKEVITLKYPYHLLGVMDFLLKKIRGFKSDSAEISESATLEGEVYVEDGAKILENAVVRGPAYIGKNAFVGNNVVLRGGVDLEENAVAGTNTEIKHSLLGRDSSIHSGYLGDSILGEDVKIAAFFVSGNVRLDRGEIKVRVKDETVGSKEKSLGTMVGDGARIGVRVTTMPGVFIGSDAIIGPQTVVFKNVADKTSFYNEYSKTTEKDNHSRGEKEKIILFDIDYTLFDTKLFKESKLSEYSLYEESLETLDMLGASVKLGIFSEGDLDFQKSKLIKTLIHDRFPEEHVHIVESKKLSVTGVIEKYKDSQLILVDDKLEVLEQAKKISENVITIWVKRGPFAESTESIFTPDHKVSVLSELPALINNIF